MPYHEKNVDWGKYGAAALFSLSRTLTAILMLRLEGVLDTDFSRINQVWLERVQNSFGNGSLIELADSAVEVSPVIMLVLFVLMIYGLYSDGKDGQLARESGVKKEYPNIADTIGGTLDHLMADLPFFLASFIYLFGVLPELIAAVQSAQ